MNNAEQGASRGGNTGTSALPGFRAVNPDRWACGLFGLAQSPEAFDLREFLSQSVVRFEWVEVKDLAHARELGLNIERLEQLPLLRLPGGEDLISPTRLDVAQRLGWINQPSKREYDLLVLGAGPAGLSAAVYAASEGLSTVVIERSAVGGQSGSSPLIENVIGWPRGIPGAELAERARQQAVKFGVELLMLREGVAVRFHAGRVSVELEDGLRVSAKADVLATGVEYTRLDVPDHDRFLGAGLAYGAGASEASVCHKDPVVVVGGANSAGQAVSFFSRRCPKVTMVIRGPKFGGSMSAYLADRIRACENVDVKTDSEVVRLHGREGLEAITIRNSKTGREEEMPTSRLFVCIGGKPNTSWADGTGLVRDRAGYIVTGPDLFNGARDSGDESGGEKEGGRKDSPGVGVRGGGGDASGRGTGGWSGDEGEDGESRGHRGSVWPLERPPYFLETSIPGSFAAGDVRHGSVKRFATALGEGAMCVTLVHRWLRERDSTRAPS